MPPDGLHGFSGLYGRAVVVDPSEEVTCCTNIMFRTTFASDEIHVDALVCAARRVSKYLLAAICGGTFKTVRVGDVLAKRHRASGIRTSFKTTI